MRFEERGCYTGRQMEAELLGSLENPRDMPELEKKFKEAGYIRLKDAMQVIKRHQPFEDPSDPNPRFANDLHAKVAEKLNIDNYENVRFYTAVGTYIDLANGVDAFMEIDKDGETIFVTLDVTINSKKDSHKADVVFFVSSNGIDPKENRAEYMEKIEEVSNSVVEAFNNNLKKITRKG
ncbi:MAG: hypothetical protein WAV16_00595 [Candidatus Moraniibacteriota bacterium]